MSQPNKDKGLDEIKEEQIKIKRYIELVDIVRKSKKPKEIDMAFSEIVQMMDVKLKQFSYKFNIPGLGRQDIYQEALFALRYKAIKDYDSTRSNLEEISPFDKFATICIRRHLSTKLKSSFQNRAKVLNLSISLDQDRNTKSDNSLYLVDLITEDSDDSYTEMKNKEYYNNLFKKLLEKLSDFEKKVFVLYARKMSYAEMSERLIDTLSEKEKENIIVQSVCKNIKILSKSRRKKDQDIKLYINEELNKGSTFKDIATKMKKDLTRKEKEEMISTRIIKSIDNALSRVKTKAKTIFNKYDK